jgi:competence protein ComEC
LPALRQLGVGHLDLLLLSHADKDHSGGAPAVFAGLPVREVRSGEPEKLPEQLAALPCIDDARWEWDGVEFRTWRWPFAPDGNAASCVLKVSANGESLLLTGDIDIRSELALLVAGRPLRSDWLLSPHHGSRSSSSSRFLRAVAPRAVLISRGRHNPYGHPHPLVLQRYRELPARVYDSAVSGALRVDLGRFAEARGMRSEARFWRQK